MEYKKIKPIPTQYKHVQKILETKGFYFRVAVKELSKNRYETEKEAAMALDKWLIKNGKEPINILVRIKEQL